MPLSIGPAYDWPHVLRLANAACELTVTLDVGPRVMAYAFLGGENPFKVYPDQVGTTGEREWRARGGHRLWTAPESRELTYVHDNAVVRHEALGDHAVRLIAPLEESTRLVKEIELHLSAEGTEVQLVHRITSVDGPPRRIAAWALTVMEAGGSAIIPMPPAGEHPRDLLPNRSLVLWPYTDLADSRWRLDTRFITLRHDAARGPTKIGLAHPVGQLAYAWQDVLFVKNFAFDPAAIYPDMGSNAEVFANHRMVELESLSPLVDLPPGETIEHRERWRLFQIPRKVDFSDDGEIAALFEDLGVAG